MNSRCPKLAHGKKKTTTTTKHGKPKAKQRVKTSLETVRNQLISTRRKKMPKCENKQKQEKITL